MPPGKPQQNADVERHNRTVRYNWLSQDLFDSIKAGFLIVFVATGGESTARGRKKKISCFPIDRDTPGLETRAGYESVSHTQPGAQSGGTRDLGA